MKADKGEMVWYEALEEDADGVLLVSVSLSNGGGGAATIRITPLF